MLGDNDFLSKSVMLMAAILVLVYSILAALLPLAVMFTIVVVGLHWIGWV